MTWPLRVECLGAPTAKRMPSALRLTLVPNSAPAFAPSGAFSVPSGERVSNPSENPGRRASRAEKLENLADGNAGGGSDGFARGVGASIGERVFGFGHRAFLARLAA